jgi:hypothetical protein
MVEVYHGGNRRQDDYGRTHTILALQQLLNYWHIEFIEYMNSDPPKMCPAGRKNHELG